MGKDQENNTPPASSKPDMNVLLQENTTLKQRIAELEAEKNQRSQDDPLIQEKINAGLTREQAETVVSQQRVHDEWLAKQDASRKAATK